MADSLWQRFFVLGNFNGMNVLMTSSVLRWLTALVFLGAPIITTVAIAIDPSAELLRCAMVYGFMGCCFTVGLVGQLILGAIPRIDVRSAKPFKDQQLNDPRIRLLATAFILIYFAPLAWFGWLILWG
jgi:hypothetical protein